MHSSGLTDRQVAEIQDKWRRRTTIASLADDYGVSTDVIRHLISIPEERKGGNQN
jgi:hypothetical protein